MSYYTGVSLPYLQQFHHDLQGSALPACVVVEGEVDTVHGLDSVVLPLELGEEHVVHTLHAHVPHLLDDLLQHKLLRGDCYHAESAGREGGEGGREGGG